MVCVPGLRGILCPFHSNTPLTPSGKVTSPETASPSKRSFVRIMPLGCGVAASIHFNPPGWGAIRTDLNQGSAGVTPATAE